MTLDKTRISNQTFSISGFSHKFRIAKNKGLVKSALEESGATVEKSGEKCIIGRETSNFYTAFANEDYIFEGELEDRSYQQDFTYFKDYDLKLYDMMRKLLATNNISFSYILIGEPLKEDDFAKMEKKLKRPIPKAVKEFYSIFGELRILWTHRNPYERTGVSASKTAWNMDYYDNHIGSFQILPLKTVLFENWEDERYCLGTGSDLKVFDSSSSYYLAAFDITHESDPLVYRGEDYGVTFGDATPLLFTEYMNLCIGLYGSRERLEYFLTPGFGRNITDAEQKNAIAGRIAVDINNDAYLIPKIQEITAEADRLLEASEYKAAQDLLMDLSSLDEKLFSRYLMDLDRLQAKADSFAERMKYYVRDKKVDWKAYEAQHPGDPIFESKAYQKVRKKLV